MKKIFCLISVLSIQSLACDQMGWAVASQEMNRLAKANNAKTYYWSYSERIGESYQWDFLIPQSSAPLVGTVTVSAQDCYVIRSRVFPAIGKVDVH